METIDKIARAHRAQWLCPRKNAVPKTANPTEPHLAALYPAVLIGSAWDDLSASRKLGKVTNSH